MFPLGTVLLPGMVLRLHVFEERYRALMRACLTAPDPPGRAFGVVLIARGSEVGGGDQRFDAGCVARVQEHEELADGRWLVRARGDARLRVRRWIAEDPYPLADVEVRPDDEAGADGRADDGLWHDCESAVRSALAHQAELGMATFPATVVLPADRVAALWQLCAMVPAGPLDRQRLLEAAHHGDRLQLLRRIATDAVELLAWRLSAG
jgi:ATP-dependent Lon protease